MTTTDDTAQAALVQAAELLAAGVPVFTAPANPRYDKSVHDGKDSRSKEYLLPTGWQHFTADTIPADHSLAAWVPGSAVCVVTGHGLDAADIDPKNGAEVVAQRDRLAALGVDLLGVVVTPSAGAHFYTRSTGICSSNRTEVGVDYRGRGVDGTGSGFLYLPGTLRPKYDGKGYLWATPIDPTDLDDLTPTEDNTDAVATYLTGLGVKVRTRDESSEVVGGEPVDLDALRPWLRELLADTGPAWTLADGTESRDRSARFFHLVAGCRRANLTQGQAVTLLDPWCHSVGKYAGRVGPEVARAWSRVEPDTTNAPEAGSALDALEATLSETGSTLPDSEGADEDNGPTTWAPVDLTSYLDGSYVPEVPSLFVRSDGNALLYPGRLHSFHGESESGKSLVAQAEAARLLALGESVLFVDMESDAGSVVGRLLALGAPKESIASGLVYVRPDASLRDPKALRDLDSVLSRKYALAVVDGVTEALALLTDGGGKPEDQIAAFVRLLPRRIARRTGAAVVQVDHVTKSTEGRGRFALGSQHKMNALDGAAYVVEVSQPLGLGLRGVIVLRVAKDRPGSVRPTCGLYRKSDRTQEAARVIVDATVPGRTTVTVEPPSSKVGDHDDDESAAWRPTAYMERVSRYLEGQTEALSIGSVVTGVGGKRSVVLDALDALAAEGWVSRESGPRGAKLHTSTRAYRETDDEKSDRYLGSGNGSDPDDPSNAPESDPFPFPPLRQGERGTGQFNTSPVPGNGSGTGREQVGTGQREDLDLYDTSRDPWTEPPIHACAGDICSVPGCPNSATA